MPEEKIPRAHAPLAFELLVGAGGGAVLLRDVQLEGKRRMSARNFLLGHPVAPGTVLGKSEIRNPKSETNSKCE